MFASEMLEEINTPSRTGHEFSKHSSLTYFQKPPQKPLNLNMKINSASEIERLQENIGEIPFKYLHSHHDMGKVLEFRNKYKQYLRGNYIDLILTMKEFPEFNILDYIKINVNSSSRNDQKRLIQGRNNIILSILTVAKEAQILEKNNMLIPSESFNSNEQKSNDNINNDDMNNSNIKLNPARMSKGFLDKKPEKQEIFGDLSFLHSLADELKNFIIEDSSSTFTNRIVKKCSAQIPANFNDKKVKSPRIFEYEVEVFFLSLLEYKDKARIIKQKYNRYFKELIASLNLPNKFSFDNLINTTVDKETFSQYTQSEVIVLRKILASAAKRKFFYGLEFLLKINQFNLVMSEGRIWKKIGVYLPKEEAYSLWSLYEANIDMVRTAQLKETIDYEYQGRINEMNAKLKNFKDKTDQKSKTKTEKLLYAIAELEKGKRLHFVTCFKELIVIFFRYDLKEVVIYFLEQFLSKKKEKRIPIEIYEICLDYDEDISIDLMDKALNSTNVKREYLQLSLLKKAFQLALKLLKYDACQNYLNESKTNKNDDVLLMYKKEVAERDEMVRKILFNKEYKNEGDKLLVYLRDNLKKKEEEKEKEKEKKEEKEVKLEDKIEEKGEKEERGETLYQSSGMNNTNVEAQTSINHLISKHNSGTKLGTKFGILNKQISQKKLSSKFWRANSSNPKLLLKNSEKMKIGGEFLDKNSVFKYHQELKMDKFNFEPKTPKPTGQAKHGHFTVLKPKVRSTLKEIIEPAYKDTVLSSGNDDESITGEIKLANLKDKKISINAQLILIESLRFGEYAFYALCLLSSIEINRISLEYSEKICNYLFVFTTSEEALTKSSYPLLLIALSSEFLSKIGRYREMLRYKTNTVTFELLKLGRSIQEAMKSDGSLYYFLLQQTDNVGRSALEIYAENNFTSMLDDTSVLKLAEDMWSRKNEGRSVLKYFRLSRIISSSIVYENYQDIVKVDYIGADTVYTFQFFHYINNCALRFKINILTTVFGTILYQITIYLYVEDMKKDIKKFYEDPLLTVNKLTDIWGALSLLWSGQQMTYFHKTGRRIDTSKTEMVLKLVFLLAIFFNIIDFSGSVFNRETDADSNVTLQGMIYCILITASWLQVINLLLKTRYYGSFFRIMFKILWHVLTFMLVCCGFTFLFAQMFTVFFGKTNEAFQGIYYSFLTLFSTYFGRMEFTDFNALLVFGYVALMLFTTVANIILFNLIVGIMNNYFSKYEESALAENRSAWILVHERIKWDERFGLLILLPPPFNIISLLLSPILFFYSRKKETETKNINLLLSKICYFFIAFFYFLYLVIFGIVIYPITYFKSITHSFYDNYFDYGKLKFSDTLKIIFLRFFELAKFYFEDLFNFWRITYKNYQIHDNKKENRALRQYILGIRKVLNVFKFKDKKKMVTKNELYQKLGLINKETQKKFSFSNNSVHIRKQKTEELESQLLKQKTTKSTDSQKFFSNLDQETVHITLIGLINKMVDTDGLVDIERTLQLMPYKVKYSEEFLNNLHNTNVCTLIKGFRKYSFDNDEQDPTLVCQKLQLLAHKMYLKFNLIYKYIPNDILEVIKQNFDNINEDPQFNKGKQLLLSNQQKDEISDYDDTSEGGKNATTSLSGDQTTE